MSGRLRRIGAFETLGNRLAVLSSRGTSSVWHLFCLAYREAATSSALIDVRPSRGRLGTVYPGLKPAEAPGYTTEEPDETLILLRASAANSSLTNTRMP